MQHCCNFDKLCGEVYYLYPHVVPWYWCTPLILVLVTIGTLVHLFYFYFYSSTRCSEHVTL
jgi:hypothetical protein